MTEDDKKQPSNSEQDSFSLTTQGIEDPLVEWSALIAKIIVGASPYLDISMCHIMVMDAIARGLDHDGAAELGKAIAIKARISIDRDSYGGVH